MSDKYLYGASVQGIQNFIFQTNKLKEIVGASELVENICTNFFKEQVNNFNSDNLILGAAGNIKYIFDDAPSCQELVMKFPKAVMEMAPGITISQAVVRMDGSGKETQTLEDRLRIQRNKSISITVGIGLMITETARRTGNAGVSYIRNDEKKEVIDLGQKLKIAAFNNANKKLVSKITGSNKIEHESFPYDITEMLDSEDNQSWIAVIHADGNNLGQLIMKIVESCKGDIQQTIRNFSKLLNETTIEAAAKAFNSLIKKNKKGKIPFRPVVLGGDDLIAIIRGDLALDYTHLFLQEFESLSLSKFQNFSKNNNLEEDLFKEGLTSCAGISYIKANYPFHYAVKLAKSLCEEAKTIAKTIAKKINKNQTPSSLLFHKVHASFVEEYEDIIDQELSAKNNVQFNYGPYFTHSQSGYATINQLQNWIKTIMRKDAPKAGLRNWLVELQHNPENADQLLGRIKTLNPYFNKKEKLNLSKPFVARERMKNTEKIQIICTPIFDIISLSTIQPGNENE